MLTLKKPEPLYAEQLFTDTDVIHLVSADTVVLI